MSDYYNGETARTEAREFGAKIIEVIGMRSNGKSYDILNYSLNRYKNEGVKMVYVRRWREDLQKKFMATLFAKHDSNVRFYQGAFYYGEEKAPFCVTTSLSSSEHFKGFTATSDFKIIMFDECFTRRRELPNEFDLWQDVVSTIVRDRDDVEVYMVGNTVKRISCYFTEYGIDIKKLKKGKINKITVKGIDGDELKIVCEWCDKNGKTSQNKSLYFVNNKSSNMITDGDFESDLHYTQTLNGVNISNWNNARKLPFAFVHNSIIIEIRIYNGVLLAKYGRKSKYNISKQIFGGDDGRIYKNNFPFYTTNSGLNQIQTAIYKQIVENQFIAEDVDAAEILMEIVRG